MSVFFVFLLVLGLVNKTHSNLKDETVLALFDGVFDLTWTAWFGGSRRLMAGKARRNTDVSINSVLNPSPCWFCAVFFLFGGGGGGGGELLSFVPCCSVGSFVY